MAEKNKGKLELAMEKLNKQNGIGSVMYLSTENTPDMVRIPSGSLGIDSITGGGFPLGRMVEIYGWESSGKTTLVLQTIKNAQDMGLTCCFIDMEQAYDFSYATSLGVDNSKIVFLQPDNGEQALQSARELIETGEIDVIAIDSIATLIPKAEIEGEVGDNQMGLHARMMSKGCRMISPIANENDVLVLWTNQLREKIGVMFGDPRTTPGGNAMKFFASIRIELTSLNSKTEVGEDGNKMSKRVRAKCIKNKTFPPFRECEYAIEFGKGVDMLGEIFDLAVTKNIIHRAGSWYSYEDAKLGQGAPAAKSLLNDNPELLDEIKSLINAVEV